MTTQLFYKISEETRDQLNDLFGPFAIINPLLSILVAFLPTVVYAFTVKTPASSKVAGFTLLWYGIVLLISPYSTLSSTIDLENLEAFQYPNNQLGFNLFSMIPMIWMILGYFGLYRKDAHVKQFFYEYPIPLMIGQQLYRISGGFCWYFYFKYARRYNFDSPFNFITGLLDMLIGVTAIPLALFVYSIQQENVKAGSPDTTNVNIVRSMLYYWNIIGLSTVVIALSCVMTTYFGISNFNMCNHTLMYLTFPPMPLIMYYQVPCCIMTHLLYITNLDTIMGAQNLGSTVNTAGSSKKTN